MPLRTQIEQSHRMACSIRGAENVNLTAPQWQRPEYVIIGAPCVCLELMVVKLWITARLTATKRGLLWPMFC